MRERPVELVRALAVLAEDPTPAHAGVAEALGLPEPPGPVGHADLLLFHLHPWASVHLGPEGMLGGEARARVAGFWRAVGRTPPPEPDHLAALLGLYAALLAEAQELEAGAEPGEGAGLDDHAPAGTPAAASGAGAGSRRPDHGEARAAAALVDRAAGALLHEHLLSWLPPFLDRVRDLGDAHQAGWADLLGITLLTEAAAVPRPPEPSRHLRDAPSLPDPREGDAPGFVSGLLAPVRSGVLLTRHDLAALARDRGMGVRAGERRYALEHLLGLDPEGVLSGLADFARKQAEAHDRWPVELADVRRFWSERARRTASLLHELAAAGVAG